jgi:hypothetical protein
MGNNRKDGACAPMEARWREYVCWKRFFEGVPDAPGVGFWARPLEGAVMRPITKPDGQGWR